MARQKTGKKHPGIRRLEHSLPPTVLTIFGATGDLSSDYLLPALVNMDREKLLPGNFKLVCIGRRDFTSREYLDFILKKSRVLKRLHLKDKTHFLRHLVYFKGNFDDIGSFRPLAGLLADHEQPSHQCFNRLYYFATSPDFFASIARILKETGLLNSCEKHERKIRILVEKPFGFNLKSAQALNRLLLKFFQEDQIYRIDHYLGKETVQNLMVVRFANSLFEPLWNKDHISHVEISVLEKDGVGNRAAYYDQTGALKDVVQNHILQMLALTAMDEPANLSAELIRGEKVKILNALAPFDAAAISSDIVRGQYQGLVKEMGRASSAETFVALKVFLNLPRWKGVPFYLRTGKRLSKKLTEISIHFKEPLRCLFRGCGANILTFRIQPDESVHLQINNKIPGFGIELHPGDLEFGYWQAFSGKLPSAYERLLLDFMEGDQRLFIRSDEIEAAWKFIDSIAGKWDKAVNPMYGYKSGANGPEAAAKFIEKDLREWKTK